MTRPSLLTLILLAPAAPQSALAAAPPRAPSQEPTRVIVPVQGLGCGSCAEHLEARLAALDGVRAAEVSVERARAEVEYDPKVITVAQIVAEVDRVFTAGRPEVEAP